MEKSTVKRIPEGYHTLTIFMVVNGAARLIDFLKQAFDAKENSIHKTNQGTIMHAELQIGDSRLMLSDATPQYPAMSSMVHMYLEDVDSVYKKAIAAGGISLREPTDEFYGDRSAGIKDPSGNQWWMATHIEDVSEEEMRKREEEWRKERRQSQ